MNRAQSPEQLKDEIEEWLVQWIAKELGLPSAVTAMMLVGDLEEWLTLTLPPTLVWDHPSIVAIAAFLTNEIGTQAAVTQAANGAIHSVDSKIPSGTGAQAMVPLDEMSDQEVSALLNQLIADESAGLSR
jgi:acyl carrier protein